MRSSFLWLLLGATSVGACVVGSLGGVPAAAQDASRPSASVSDETVKDVEVMRRVLVREGLATRTNGNVTSADGRAIDFYVTYAASGISSSEAFVVPGQGATFVLRTSDAVASPKGADDSASGADKPSAWDEEAAALDGKSVVSTAHRRAIRYETAKVDALKTRVLDVLAKYGQKIRGLAPSDRITVIVVGGSGGVFLEPQTVNADPDAKGGYRAALVSALGHPGGDRTVLTITVSLGDCQSAAGGTLSADEFKRRASVSAY